MTVKIKGVSDVEKALNDMIGSAKTARALNDAVNAGGELMVIKLRVAFKSFADTGASRDAIVRTEARLSTRTDDRSLIVGFSKHKGRYALVHLNEFGYTRHGRRYRPRGMGAIQRTVADNQSNYFSTVEREIKKVLFNG